MVSMVPKARPLFHRAFVAVLLIPLFACVLAQAQTETPDLTQTAPAQSTLPEEAPGSSAARPPARAPNGLAVWDLRDRTMTAMLAAPPRKEEERYARLRHDFAAFGCTGDHLSELDLPKDKNHPILLCTLPGMTASKIVVTARLTRNELFDGATDGWADADLLPMLYHALKAQPRRSTFVFAELGGGHADMDFQNQLEADGAPAPLALVSIEVLGFGQQGFINLPAADLEPGVRSNSDALQIEAWRLIRLQGVDTARQTVSSQFSSGPVFHPSLVRDGPKDIPRILLYSNPVVLPGRNPAFDLAAFHRNHDFLAFYLADIDRKLSPAAPPD
ncbi:MAG TPA: hypothetical protein VHZ25_05155 [Acidobacteriaceae bacterium]|jgi:hypothetical protein|nr:hypothetical protein [Acidobacteriaceae bacterium]